MSEPDSPFTADDVSDRTEAGGHAPGNVAVVMDDRFLAAPAWSATPGWSRVRQQDMAAKSTLLQDGRTYEGNKNVLIDEDVPRPTAARFILQSGFHNLSGRRKEADFSSYPTHNGFSSYPTHNGFNIASTNLWDLQQLAPSSSSMGHHLDENLSNHLVQTSHTTDIDHITSSFADNASGPDKNSHTVHHGFHSIVDAGRRTSEFIPPARNTNMLKQKIHPRMWVSFEEEDNNISSTRVCVSADVNHHPTAAPFESHVTVCGLPATNSSSEGRATDNLTYTANWGRTTPGFSRHGNEAVTDDAVHLQLIVKASSLKPYPERASAPIFLRGGRHRQNKGACPTNYSEDLHSNMSIQGGVTEQDNSFLQHQARMHTRPHSVNTTTHVTNKVYDFAAGISNTSATAHQRRRQFATSHRNSMSSILPDDSILKHAVNDSQEPKRNIVQQNIFRTSSSGSLHSDSSVNLATPTVRSGDLWQRARTWVSRLLHKEGTSARLLIDDSMDFSPQPALTDKVLNVDKKCLKQAHGSPDQDDSGNPQPSRDTCGERSDQAGDTKPDTKTAVYKKRWYLLFLFSVSAMLWNAVWSTWGPIAQSAKDVYQWTDADIAMFIWLGNIPFLLTMFPCCYLMDVKGMRIAMIVACGFMFLGTGCRCIPSDVTTATWLIRTGQFLNGMAGTIPNSAPALLSSLWFPPNQRASATAISTVAGYMGASVSFVIGPLLVPQPDDLLPVNNTDDLPSYDVSDFLDTNNMTNITSYDAQKQGIMHILYAECAVAGLLLLLVLVYFPSKPPLPPSVSASMPREKYIPGLKMLLRNKQFWVCAVAFSVPAGVYEAWQVILDVILDDKGVNQQTAGWLDFYATVGGCVSGLLVSRFADFFTRQMKLFLLIFYFFAAVSILWFTLVVFDILPFDRVSMYAAIIIAGVFLDGGGPLFFELTIEVSYPVGEGVTSGFTQMLCAGAGICFLSVVQVESLGKEWINWYFLGCVAMAIPLLFFITTTYGRADIDDELQQEEDDELEDTPSSPDTDEKTYLFGSSHV